MSDAMSDADVPAPGAPVHAGAAAGTALGIPTAVGTATVDTATAETGTAETGAVDAGTVETGPAETGTADTGAVDPGAVDPGAGDPGAGDTGAATVIGALSPSRADDFMTCPLLYRFRVIDRLPEPPSPAAARGTLVHAVLERLFDQPAAERTARAAHTLLEPEWQRLLEEEPGLGEMFGCEADRDAWFASAREMLDRYFVLEDPRLLEPAERELYVETVLDSGLLLRGYIDRLDVAANGDVRVVDYKTGTAPRAEFEARALFQMRFYALVLWRRDDRIPRLLQLMYLGNGEVLRYAPDEADLRATQRKTEAIWHAIERAKSREDWRPRPGRICDWCAYQHLCPAFGGTPPPVPAAPEGPQLAGADARAAARAEPLPEVPSPRSSAVDI